MPISVRFTIRNGYDTLQARLSIDGVAGSLFNPVPDGAPPIIVDGIWNQKQQKRTDRNEAAHRFNLQLAKIEARLSEICDEQRASGLQPTPKTVQQQYQTGIMPQLPPPPVPPRPDNRLIDACRLQLARLAGYAGTEHALDRTTLEKWGYGVSYLERYLTETGQPDVPVDHVGVGWAKDYHTWLMKTGPMAADSATRYVRRVSESIDGYIERLPADKQRSAYNPLAGYKFGRTKTKEVYFLEKPHLERFWQLDNRGEAGKCIWYMGMIFLTALDYPDLLTYLADPGRYNRPGNVRPSIEIRRAKSGSICRIPVWPELTALLACRPTGGPPTADQINDYMKGVEVLIGFPHRLTCKVGRKTGGYLFLLRGYTIRAVSRIMGHSSIEITERYYVKVTPELVDQETDNL